MCIYSQHSLNKLSINDLTISTKTAADFYLNSSRCSSEVNLAGNRSDRVGSVPNLIGLEKSELKMAISRHNSFISYFQHKLNIPDFTVNNLLDAVKYIVEKET